MLTNIQISNVFLGTIQLSVYPNSFLIMKAGEWDGIGEVYLKVSTIVTRMFLNVVDKLRAPSRECSSLSLAQKENIQEYVNTLV